VSAGAKFERQYYEFGHFYNMVHFVDRACGKRAGILGQRQRARIKSQMCERSNRSVAQLATCHPPTTPAGSEYSDLQIEIIHIHPKRIDGLIMQTVASGTSQVTALLLEFQPTQVIFNIAVIEAKLEQRGDHLLLACGATVGKRLRW
jgi:hypothetical protein